MNSIWTTHLLSHEMFFLLRIFLYYFLFFLFLFHKKNIQEKCGKCEWLQVVCTEKASSNVACLCDMILMCSLWIVEERMNFFITINFRLFHMRLEMSEACDALKVSPSTLLIFFFLSCLFFILFWAKKPKKWDSSNRRKPEIQQNEKS